VPSTWATTQSFVSLAPLPRWQRLAAGAEWMAQNLRVQRSFWSGRRWTSISPDRAGIGRCATAQRLETEALLLRHSLLVGPATKPDAPFPTLKVGVSLMALPGLLPLVLEVVERERGRRLQALLRRSLCQTSRHRSLCHARRWS
jgi:hypothetical protein